jgi:hypothetical protein
MPNLGPHLLQRMSCPLFLVSLPVLPGTAATQGTKDQPAPSLSKFTPHLLRGMECGRLAPGG